MQNSPRKLLISTLCLIFFLTALSSCSKTGREKALYQFVQKGIELAEAHDLGGMMDLTGDDFTAGPGNHTKKEVKRILFVILKRYGKFRILYPKPAVKLSENEETAIVKMNFLIAKKEQLFPELELLYKDSTAWLLAVDEGSDLYTLSMELHFDSGNWFMKRARITGFARPHGRM